MQEAPHHQMVLVRTFDTGAEEWHCPDCNRRFLMYWQPRYSRLILEQGDLRAVHSGGKGGLSFTAAQLNPE